VVIGDKVDRSLLKEEILKKLKQEVDSFSDSDWEKLENKTYETTLRVTRIDRKRDRVIFDLSESMMASIVETLNSFATREEGEMFLESQLKNKKSAEQVAKYLSVACTKKDKKEDLINKIVRTTIGARLRSQAIRGK
jgi:hypothetical protein